jgi:hypothetical protein
MGCPLQDGPFIFESNENIPKIFEFNIVLLCLNGLLFLFLNHGGVKIKCVNNALD